MKQIILLSFLFAFETYAGPADHFFKTVPISEAHSTFGSPSRPFLDPDSIKALVWNVQKAIQVQWKDEFVAYGSGKDLMLLQEAYDDVLFHTTLTTFAGVRWDMAISFLFLRYQGTPTGTLIGSVSLPEEFIVKHSPDLEPLTNTPKSMSIGKYHVGMANELLVISFHGINFKSFPAFKRHLDQAVEEIRKHDGPILFAGDFNSHTDSRVAYLLKTIKDLNMSEIEFVNGEFRTKAPVTGNFFDHAFVKGLAVKKAEVLKDSKGSDHRPMTLELALP